MNRVVKSATASTITTVALLVGAVACSERPMEPSVSRLRPEQPSFAVIVDEYPRIVLQPNANGVYALDRLCDIFIGDPVFDPVDGVPPKYAHQAVVVVPEGARIRVVPNRDMRLSGSKLFTCNADDPDVEGLQPVIDPVTLHAAKGDGPKIFTRGVTLDLSGHSLTVSPAFGTPVPGSTTGEVFENMGISVLGVDNTLMNSAAVSVGALDNETQREPGVSRIWGFGHNIDVEAEANPTVRGRRYAADGSTVDALNGTVFNFQADGGFGVRLSGGAITVTQVKSVNLDPVEGGGFEARRSLPGSSTIVSNSHFEGGAEGVFIREYSGITLSNNYVSGHGGPGISTREAFSSADAPIRIMNNKVVGSSIGILWGRESVNGGALRISGNTIQDSACGIGLSTDDASVAPLTLSGIASLNTFVNVTTRTCTED